MFDRKTVVKDFCISRIAVLCMAQKVNTAEDVLFLSLYQHVQAQGFKNIPVLPRVLLLPYDQRQYLYAGIQHLDGGQSSFV